MRFNIKKIAAIGTSLLLTGLTASFAAAAPFPAPFVQNGVSNVAVVYGTGANVSPLDAQYAGNIQTALNSYVTQNGATSIIPTSGEVATLDTSSTRIWLNASLNSVKQVLTNLDMPNTLATTTFSGTPASGGSASIQVTPSIVIGSGLTAGSDNSGKVIFTKQPNSNTDPSAGVSMGILATNPLYNLTLTFSQSVNFTDSGSQGQVLTLFGQPWTVASSSSNGNGLVLFGAAQTVTLSQGTSGASSATVSINGTSHTVTLANVGTGVAYISVDGSGTQSITTGTSKLINGVNVAVTSVASSTAGGNTATVLVGANQLALIDGQAVQIGTNNNQIQGTMVSFQGGTVNSTSKITIAVFAPDTLHDAIITNSSFVDPVFGGFQFAFGGLVNSQPYVSGGTTGVYIAPSGNNLMQVTFTNWNSNRATITFANNQTIGSTGYYNLSDANAFGIYPYESANLSLNWYAPIGTANYGHLLQLSSVVNNSNGINNKVTFTDVMSGVAYTATATTGSTSATLTVDGRQYTVYYGGTGASAWAEIKYPTSDSPGAGTFVLYPTIQTANGAQVMLYGPLNVSLGNFDGRGNNVTSFYLPNGNTNGLTQVTVALNSSAGSSWQINGGVAANTLLTNTSGQSVNVTVGKLTWQFGPGLTNNYTTINLVTPSVTPSTSSLITNPAIVDIEGKDVNANYNAVIISTQTPSTLTGVSTTPLFTTTSYQSGAKSLQSNNKLTQYMDYMGTLVTIDTSTTSQAIATINNVVNAQQAYAQLWIGSIGASVGGGSSAGPMLVKDTQVSSVANDNLIVVGGSCINSAAATLVGGAFCGSAWTSATGVGSGQFLIQSFGASASSGLVTGSNIALLVAGYDVADTVAAATYLTTNKPDTAADAKWTGTTSTSSVVKVQ